MHTYHHEAANTFFEMNIEEVDLLMLQKDFEKVEKMRGLPGRESARVKAIQARAGLSSANHQTLDDHDQFYKDHKILLFLFGVMGVMPVQREVGRIVFRWRSVATIYAAVFYSITTVLVVLIGYERLEILWAPGKKFDEYIYAVIFVVFLIPHFWIPFVGWGVAKEVTVYKNSWTHFQLRYYRITGKNLEFPNLEVLIVVISISCLGFAVAFLWTLSNLLAGFTLWHTCAYYHIITMINMNCALWYINCRALRDASDGLAMMFREEVRIGCASYIVAHYRHLWLALSEILQRLGNAYARTYSTYSLFMFINITIALYGFLSEVIDHGFSFSFKEMGLLVDTIYCFTLLYIFCDSTHITAIKITRPIQNILFGINLEKVEITTIREIQMFLRAIEMNPPVVSLKGYATVSREFLTSSITTMAMYMIVLVQFKVSLVQINK